MAGMRPVRLAAAIAAVVLAAGALAGAAAAHGDPASEYLAGHQVFFPIYTPVPAEARLKLAALVREANARGFPIRLALIATRRDLGTEGDAWLRPQAYARNVDADVVYAYRGRVLVVMPNGFGLVYPGHDTAGDSKLLAGLVRPDLTEAATLAVERLAAGAGIAVAPPSHVTTPAERNLHDRVVLVAAALAGLALWLAAVRLRGRRRAVKRSGAAV